jgi:peptidoglycan-associated lipoprotein
MINHARNEAMRKLLTATISLLLLALAGCAATPTAEQSGAAVEDRGKPVGPPAAVPAKPAPDTGAKPLVTAPLGAAALKDPSNILSRRSVYFDFDSNLVKDEFRPLVTAHARYLQQNPGARMRIEGNADERGSREYNIALGQRRSEAVKQMMQLLGARPDQIESVSFGEEKPRATGHDEKSWAENRRADIVYQGE